MNLIQKIKRGNLKPELYGLMVLILFINAKLPDVVIKTKFGEIIVEIDTIKAPVTAGNFLGLVNKGIYSNSEFYRVVRLDNQPYDDQKIEVIQGGLFDDSEIGKYKKIRHESTRETGILHLNGTISMARDKPGTASTEFFICLGDQPSLDYGGKRNKDGQGFAAFGKVVKGMEVVQKIHRMQDTNQYLLNPLQIDYIKILP
jgi:peptidyl-prolyl cis-trans isomerase A (cyclophilin A)